MCVKEDGSSKVTFANDLHSLKASLEIVFTEDGISISESDLQL